MGVYLYCFTPCDAAPGPYLAGIRGDPVSSLSGSAFSMWVDLQEAAPPATLESVKAHHAVVRAAWATSPACVPARFGQWFPGRAGLEKAVAGIGSALERALERVRGAGEHGVRILDPRISTGRDPQAEPEPASAGEDPGGLPRSGRAYLESLKRKQRALEVRDEQARILAEEIENALSGVIRAQRAEPLPTRHGLLSLSHLVPGEREQEYAGRLEAFRSRHAELRFLVSGPWPPYSFAP